MSALAILLRERANAKTDAALDLDAAAARDMRDDAELLCVLARVLEGRPVLSAFGAPGNWGYETPIGQALLAAWNARAAMKPGESDSLLKLARRVAALNPDVGVIGAGMLAQLVADAQQAIKPFDGPFDGGKGGAS